MQQPPANTERTAPWPHVTVLDVRYQYMKNYNYLAVDPASRTAVIVDPAWQPEKIDAAVVASGARLRGVLLTHSHPDHVHLAATVGTKYGCPIWMSAEEIAVSGFHAPGLVPIHPGTRWAGELRIQAIATPGHTAGSLCYLIGDALFTGDTLFAEGCGICPDREAACILFASLEALKARLAPHVRVYPGHSYGKPPGQPFGQLLRDNIYLQFTNPDSFAAFRMRKSWKVENIFGQ